MSAPPVVVVRRRPLKTKGPGGRPRKVEPHAHVEHAQARLTPPERVALDRVRAARGAAGLCGSESDTEWIREMLHQEVLALKVEIPVGYIEARLVRSLNKSTTPPKLRRTPG